jgi:hypothetical protein
VQDLNGSAEILGACPRLKGAVHVESIALVRKEEGDSVAGGIICECDKETAPSVRGHRGRSPDIGMDLITKMRGLLADVDLQNRLVGCVHIDACIIVLLMKLRVKHDPCHQSILNELAHRCGHNVPHVAMQLHDANDLNSIAALLM